MSRAPLSWTLTSMSFVPSSHRVSVIFFSIALLKRAALAPVPRRLSASCGTCVRYEAEDACLACMDADVDRVYAADGADGYELLYENHA